MDASEFQIRVKPIKELYPDASYIDKDILKHYFFEEESSDEDSKAINKYNQKKLFRRLTTRKLSNQNKEKGLAKFNFTNKVDAVEELNSMYFKSSIEDEGEQSEEEKTINSNLRKEIENFHIHQVNEVKPEETKILSDESITIDESIQNEFWEEFKPSARATNPNPIKDTHKVIKRRNGVLLK